MIAGTNSKISKSILKLVQYRSWPDACIADKKMILVLFCFADNLKIDHGLFWWSMHLVPHFHCCTLCQLKNQYTSHYNCSPSNYNAYVPNQKYASSLGLQCNAALPLVEDFSLLLWKSTPFFNFLGFLKFSHFPHTFETSVGSFAAWAFLIISCMVRMITPPASWRFTTKHLWLLVGL